MDICEKRKRKLTFKYGSLYGPKLTKEIDDEDFFIDCYKRAAKQLLEIVSNDKKENYNIKNRIAFLGDRGQGKTSVMRSFIHAIEQRNQTLFGNKLNSFDIITLDVVDPSMFEDCSNVLDVILGQILGKIRQSNNRDIDQTDINELLQKFNSLYTQIRIIKDKNILNKNIGIYDGSIETLLTISEITNFRENLSMLISEFLDIITKKQNDSFLVIPIDDIDIDITNCYETVETIRKYLNIPRVIVVLAAKLEQLHEGVRMENLKQLNELSKVDSAHVYEDVYNMTTKYLLKLLPQNRRIHLPEVVNTISSLQYDIDVSIEDNEESQTLPIGSLFSKLVYDKTGILLLNNFQVYNYLINSNLRDIVDLYACLYEMELPKKGSTNSTYTYLDNLEKFKDYFLNNWCTNNLNVDAARFIRRLYYEGGYYKNYSLIKMIYDLIVEEENKKDILELLKLRGHKELFYDLSDISDLLNDDEKSNYIVMKIDDKKKFVYAIKMCYTIIMNQLRRTDDLNYCSSIHNYTNFSPYLIQFVGGRVIKTENLPTLNRQDNGIDINSFDKRIKSIDYKKRGIEDGKTEILLLSMTSKDYIKNIYFYNTQNFKIDTFYFDASLFFVNCLDIEYTLQYLINPKFKNSIEYEVKRIDQDNLFKNREKLELVARTVICNFGVYDFYVDWIKNRYDQTVFDNSNIIDLSDFYSATNGWINQLMKDLEKQNGEMFKSSDIYIALKEVENYLSNFIRIAKDLNSYDVPK